MNGNGNLIPTPLRCEQTEANQRGPNRNPKLPLHLLQQWTLDDGTWAHDSILKKPFRMQYPCPSRPGTGGENKDPNKFLLLSLLSLSHVALQSGVKTMRQQKNPLSLHDVWSGGSKKCWRNVNIANSSGMITGGMGEACRRFGGQDWNGRAAGGWSVALSIG